MFKHKTNLNVGISHRILIFHWLMHQSESIWSQIHGQDLGTLFMEYTHQAESSRNETHSELRLFYRVVQQECNYVNIFLWTSDNCRWRKPGFGVYIQT